MPCPPTCLRAALLVLILAACAPASKTGLAPAGKESQTLGTAPPPGAEAPEPQPGIILREPGGTQWVKPGVTDERYRADLEDCYRYAQAQVAHDARIESDSGAAFESFPSGLGWTELRGRMSEFERNQRRSILFSNCMVAKGYDRG